MKFLKRFFPILLILSASAIVVFVLFTKRDKPFYDHSGASHVAPQTLGNAAPSLSKPA